MRWITLAAAATALLAPAITVAQSSGASTCSQGQLTRIRLSKIKPNGSMAGFRDAVAAHTRWYKAHGYRMEQRIAPVVTFASGRTESNGARAGYGRKRTYRQVNASAGSGGSSQEVMTFVTSDDVPREKHDAGWNAFVAKYRANSQMERETIVCMPR